MAQDRSIHGKDGLFKGSRPLPTDIPTPAPASSNIFADLIEPGQVTFDTVAMGYRIQQFKVAKAEKLANAVIAFDAYQNARTIYSRSLVDSDYDEDGGSTSHLSPEARKNYDLVGEATQVFHAFREANESVDELIARIEREKRREFDEVKFNNADDEDKLKILELAFDDAADAYAEAVVAGGVNSYGHMVEGTNQKYYDVLATGKAVQEFKQLILETAYDNSCEAYTDASTLFFREAGPLSDGDFDFQGSAQANEAEVERITSEFWATHLAYTNAANALITFTKEDHAREVAKLKEVDDDWSASEALLAGEQQRLELHKKEQQQMTLATLRGRVVDFEVAYERATTHSEEAESEETWDRGVALSQAKDMVERFQEFVVTDRKNMGLSSIEKAEIDNMSFQAMLKLQRFSPVGVWNPLWISGDPQSDYFQDHMKKLRDEDPDGAVRASKNIGW